MVIIMSFLCVGKIFRLGIISFFTLDNRYWWFWWKNNYLLLNLLSYFLYSLFLISLLFICLHTFCPKPEWFIFDAKAILCFNHDDDQIFIIIKSLVWSKWRGYGRNYFLSFFLSTCRFTSEVNFKFDQGLSTA